MIVRRRPGRPKVVRPAPTADEMVYVAAVNAARDVHIEVDPLVGAMRDGADADVVLEQVLAEIATESAALLWEIRQGRTNGRDTAQLCSRRIDALSKIALVQLARVKLGVGDTLSPNHPKMDAIVNFFLSTVSGVLDETLPASESSRVGRLIETSLRAWQSGHASSPSEKPT